MPDAALLHASWPAFALLFGLIVGSFANVVVHRLPLQESVVSPRSRCPGCRRPIRPGDNVPVLSWLVLRGRCRDCGQAISWRYPAVELVSGLLYLAIALERPPSLEALFRMAFVTALLVLALIDFDVQILPDVITKPGIAVGLLFSWMVGGWGQLFLHAAAAAAGYLVFAALALTWLKVRKVEALGQGDWKLAAMLGAFLGGEQLLLTVFLSSLTGTIVGLALMVFARRSFQQKLPYGTFLGLAGIAALFVGHPLVAWYKGLLP